MDSRVQEILDNATDKQQDYVIARLTHPNVAQAARAVGLTRSAPNHWDNLDELEEAVQILRRDAVEAARLALLDLALEAVKALEKALTKGSVPAARTILDRVGLPAMSAVDVTSGGETIKAVVYIPENGRD